MADVVRERRRAPRARASAACEFALPVTVPIEVLDVSESGVLMRSSAPMATARRCRLRLRLLDQPFAAEVSVCRCTPSDPGGDEYRIAATFTNMAEDDRRALQRFLGTEPEWQ